MLASPSPSHMQVWACLAYGGPEQLQLQRRPIPTCRPDELLVRVHATTIASADVRIRTLALPRGFGWLGRLIFGLRRPRQPVLGTDLAGVVVDVGPDVGEYRIGDRVLAMPGAAMGCHAEYRTVRSNAAIARIPEGISFEDAAALAFGGTTALHFLRCSDLKSGDALLVIGASGAVGSAMVQLGRHLGASVTAVTSTPNLDLVRSLGAGHVLDYTRQRLHDLPHTYDVIADTVAASSFKSCLPLLNERGRYLAIAGGLPDMLARRRGTRRSISGMAREHSEDLATLLRLTAEGKLRPVIDHVVDWPDLPRAHAHVETGHKRGSLVVRPPQCPS